MPLSVFSSLKALELLCEKAIRTCERSLGVAEALRRVLECVSSGILLEGRCFFPPVVSECFCEGVISKCSVN